MPKRFLAEPARCRGGRIRLTTISWKPRAKTFFSADIEIRCNHLFKPMFWMQGQPGFKAPAFIVKNHFELKNAQRVLFDSNILDDNWGGFSQHGYSILLTPKNHDGDGASVCP